MRLLPLLCLLLPIGLLGGCSGDAGGIDSDVSDVGNVGNVGDVGDVGEPAAGSDSATDTDGSLPPPALQDNTPAGELLASINRLAVTVLDELNDKLGSGIALSSIEERCLGTFDTALGEPLLGIECDPLLVLTARRVLVADLRLVNTPQCKSSLLDADGADCIVESAAFEIPTRFVAPDVGRPQPVIGVVVDYRNADATRMIVESNADALAGPFRCEIDLTNGLPTAQSSTFTDCAVELERAAALLEDALASFAPSGALPIADI